MTSSNLDGLNIITTFVSFPFVLAVYDSTGTAFSTDTFGTADAPALGIPADARARVGIKSAYADGRLCSVASRPLISSSLETRRPCVFLSTKNTIVIVTAVHNATAANPIVCLPRSENPPP